MLSRYLTKANRISAWLLVLLFIIYGITGYIWTRGARDREMAVFLHSSLTMPLIILLSFHGLYSIRLMLLSWGIGPRREIDFSLAALGAFFIIGSAYVVYFK